MTDATALLREAQRRLRLYWQAVDMMADGPDDSDVAWAEARLGEGHIGTRDVLAEIDAYLAAAPTPAQPVAYAIRSKRDGSFLFGSTIAPVGWSRFDALMREAATHAWVQSGAAEIAPLYAAPPARADAEDAPCDCTDIVEDARLAGFLSAQLPGLHHTHPSDVLDAISEYRALRAAPGDKA